MVVAAVISPSSFAVVGLRTIASGRPIATPTNPPEPASESACALLSERLPALAGDLEADSDLFGLVDRPGSLPAPLRELARELESAAGRVLGRRADDDETALRRALFEGFPDRLARRREPGSSRFVLASGHGARLDEASAVRRAELVVALDLAARAPRR